MTATEKSHMQNSDHFGVMRMNKSNNYGNLRSIWFLKLKYTTDKRLRSRVFTKAAFI